MDEGKEKDGGVGYFHRGLETGMVPVMKVAFDLGVFETDVVVSDHSGVDSQNKG
jgi:hypothetical protein